MAEAAKNWNADIKTLGDKIVALALLQAPRSPTDEVRAKQQGLIASRFDLIEKTFSKQPYLLGDHFTAADAYLFNMLRWVEVSKLELARWPALSAFYQRLLQRPAVKAALEAEKRR